MFQVAGLGQDGSCLSFGAAASTVCAGCLSISRGRRVFGRERLLGVRSQVLAAFVLGSAYGRVWGV